MNQQAQSLRRFFTRSTVFLLLGLGLSFVPPLFKDKRAEVVYEAEQRSREDFSARVVVLGDSVCRELFREENEVPGERRHLACNVGISMVGQYILAANAFEHDPGLREVQLLVHPKSFGNHLGNVYTMNYFVKPFYRRAYFKHFSPLVWQRLNQRPVCKLALFFPIRHSQILSTVDFTGTSPKAPPHHYFLSDISLEYLVKLRQLTAQHGARLRLIAPPMSDAVSRSFDFMKGQARAAGLDDLFAEYFAGMKFFPEDLYSDSCHLKREHWPEFQRKYMAISSQTLNGT